jgi:dienelactone hydrolase
VIRAWRRACVIVAVLAIGVAPAFGTTGVRVSFPSLDIDPLHGTPLILSGLFFTPDPSAGGFPAVVVLHGCDGMYSTAPARRGLLTPRHQAMADMLVAEGYAVLFPDSFNPRGRREVCTQPLARQAIVQANRRLDVLGALDYLRTRDDIATRRIALLGWSHGGGAVLASIDERSPLVAAYAHDPAHSGFFVTAVAFYPGCYASLRGSDAFAPATPVSIFIGEADDWTAAPPCVELGRRARLQGLPVTVTTYPATHHGFDTPNLARPLHLNVPNGVHPGNGVTIAPNPAARADAYARVKAQLRAALMP